MFNKENPVVEFVSTIPQLKEIKDVQPYPANKLIPSWWKNMPYAIEENEIKYRTDSNLVKQCPMFPDLFSSGYILPMWADTTLYFNSDSGEWRWRCGNQQSPFKINMFGYQQFMQFVPYTYEGSKIKAVWQFENPWRIKTSKGYSVFQLPLFYHFNDDYSVLPGTYDGYNVYTNKLEVATFTDKKEIFIKRGTPLVQYVPYKKSNIDMFIRDETQNDKDNEDYKFINRQTMFKNWYAQNRNRGEKF